MNLQTIVVGPFAVNCYLYWNEKTGDGVIIDPGAEERSISDAVKSAGFEPKAILLTHGHGDHIGAVAGIRESMSIPVYIARDEAPLLSDPEANASASFDMPIVVDKADYLVEDEELLTLGGVKLKALAMSGHSPCGLGYLDETNGLIFCGDCLFAGSIGRTDLPGGDHQTLLDSIDRKLLTLPDDVVCYPGHGPATTIGAERNSNPFLIGGHLA